MKNGALFTSQFNQDDLIRLRAERSVQKLKPGITGWTQINGRDELSISDPIPYKVKLDVDYMRQQFLFFDLKNNCFNGS